MGQVSGIAFIFGMDGLKSKVSGSMANPLTGMIFLMIIALIISSRLKESKILTNSEFALNPDLQVNAVPVKTID